MNVRGIGASHVGMRRPRNEDCMLVDNSTGLYVVADGLGGHRAGDVASALAVETVARFIAARRKLLARFRQGWGGEEELSQLAARAVGEACRVVYEKSQSNTEYRGMGCTLTVLLVGRRKAGIGHVGDSRLYWERDGRVRQLTSDHSYAHELVRLGVISADEVATVQGGGRLLRAIGLEPSVAVDQMLIALRPGDRFVLCSDGLWNYLAHPGVLDEQLASGPLDELPGQLVRFANERGGADNITTVVVEVERRSGDSQELSSVDITPVVNRCRDRRTPTQTLQ